MAKKNELRATIYLGKTDSKARLVYEAYEKKFGKRKCSGLIRRLLCSYADNNGLHKEVNAKLILNEYKDQKRICATEMQRKAQLENELTERYNINVNEVI